jgi:hypothetical protein
MISWPQDEAQSKPDQLDRNRLHRRRLAAITPLGQETRISPDWETIVGGTEASHLSVRANGSCRVGQPLPPIIEASLTVPGE